MTSIVSDAVARTLLVVGCGDGSVRLFDRRLPPNDSRVMAMREHQSWVVNVVLEKSTSESIVSARWGLKFVYIFSIATGIITTAGSHYGSICQWTILT